MILQAHRFVVHGFLGERGTASPWVLVAYTFGHKYLKICQKWVEHIEACIKNEPARPRSLLVEPALLIFVRHFFFSSTLKQKLSHIG